MIDSENDHSDKLPAVDLCTAAIDLSQNNLSNQFA